MTWRLDGMHDPGGSRVIDDDFFRNDATAGEIRIRQATRVWEGASGGQRYTALRMAFAIQMRMKILRRYIQKSMSQ
jgi:hypothetical protein